MNVQFGRWHLDGKPVEPEERARDSAAIAPYGPDDFGSYGCGSIHILCATLETQELSTKPQPFCSRSGAVMTFDGRLDNREDLVAKLRALCKHNSSDVEIAAGAYEAWGKECFAKFVGDWALSIWMPRTASLLLAKDTIGTRPLYYLSDGTNFLWSTALGPLLQSAGRTFDLNREYIAGWLSFFPACHLSPYIGVHSVPPSCYVLFQGAHSAIHQYWEFDPGNTIRYRTDLEYEEHFRNVFATSVSRRLRSRHPVLAELSGGMDSSSIVCMADRLISAGSATAPRLDTISYYNDNEPNWDERPYFSKVEESRQRIGRHVNVGASPTFPWPYGRDTLACLPGSATNSALRDGLAAHVASEGTRVLLSGIGGDEILGGVPNPVPELADLLRTAQFRLLSRQLMAWALGKKEPVIRLALDTLKAFLPHSIGDDEKSKCPTGWLQPSFARDYRDALRGYGRRMTLRGKLPSFQENLETLALLRRQLGCSALPFAPVYQKCYPYLDRDLLEFVFAIPREQVLRVHERRSLMRRSLRDIVPPEILRRRRKAFVARAPVLAIIANWPALLEVTDRMLSASLGIVDAARFAETLMQTRQGRSVSLWRVMRTLDLEYWLRHVKEFGLLHIPDPFVDRG